MRKYVFIIIYLVGVVVAYVVGKNNMIHFNKKLKSSVTWSVQDRAMVGFISLISWGGLIIFVAEDYITNTDFDKPANW